MEIYNTLKQDAAQKISGKEEDVLTKYEELVEALATYFAPKKNIVHERCKFNKLNLSPGQSLTQYITALKTAAASCEFTERDNMIRDRLVAQIPENALLNQMLDEGDELTLEKAVELCKRSEARKQEIVDFQETRTSQEEQINVDALQRKDQNRGTRARGKTSRRFNNKDGSTMNRKYLCKKCNSEHTAYNCPAYGKQCDSCRRYNHYAKCCPDRYKLRNNNKRKTYGIAASSSSEESDDSFYIDSISKIN